MAEDLPPSLKESLDKTKVEYRRLGNSGLRVSVPILGCMGIGDPQAQDWAVDAEQALLLLKHAYDSGVNTWDTANAYSQGASEGLIGRALREHGIPRHKVVLLTKVFWAVGEAPDVRHWDVAERIGAAKDYVNQSGLSRAAIFNAVDASLARLGTSYVDLLQVHRFDYETPLEETMRALHDLVCAGKVRYIGASSMWAVQFAQMQFVAEKNGWTKFVSMQNHYNLLYREEEREMNRFCAMTGVGLIPWAPLAQGRLARPSSSPLSSRDVAPAPRRADLAIVNRVREVAERHGWTMSQVALAWLAARVTSPVVGVSTPDRLDEVVLVRGKTLARAEERYLEEPYLPREISGHV
ncbi:putative aryl-alcohol protein [Xylaria cf. heliscus]|nr:putative aryl-alcohol protein [Xylaria cf. heliscus]